MKKHALLAIFLFASIKSIAAPYDHIHLITTNLQEATDWYVKHFGGEATRFLRYDNTDYPIDRVMYDDIALIFFEREPIGGSVGSGFDHFGFSMSNVADVIAGVVADGGKQLGEIREFGGMQLGFVEDPWGTKIEIIDDPDLRGMHHLHLSSPNPEDTLAWYEENFGGKREQWKDKLPALNYGDILLMVSQASGEIAPTEDRSIDHLGWKFSDIVATESRLKASGVEFSLDPFPFRTIRIAFVNGPDNVRIELVEEEH